MVLLPQSKEPEPQPIQEQLWNALHNAELGIIFRYSRQPNFRPAGALRDWQTEVWKPRPQDRLFFYSDLFYFRIGITVGNRP
jgi:hypothetical protein